MEYETIKTESTAHAQIITLNRPEVRNAVSVKMMEEVGAAVLESCADDNACAVIITGGKNFFSAGADLNEAIKVRTANECDHYFKNWQRLNETLENATKPVIAAIEGFCMTGGCELALACDLRVAGEGAIFAITSAKIGTVAGAGGTQRLPRIIGIANALDLLLSAENIDVEKAYRIGLVNRRTPPGKALDSALSIAQIFAARAPLSLSLTKKAVYRGMQMDLASGIELERLIVTTIYGTNDKQEGMAAFLEKRKPLFNGS